VTGIETVTVVTIGSNPKRDKWRFGLDDRQVISVR